MVLTVSPIESLCAYIATKGVPHAAVSETQEASRNLLVLSTTNRVGLLLGPTEDHMTSDLTGKMPPSPVTVRSSHPKNKSMKD